ncbi:MAG: preprotein translocase subunit SecE [Elusimicrobia bacterium]|nr:preprotein translocase subunit SecE [Elusimicrobiota bacterium]
MPDPVTFVRESYLELKKSTWLTRQQAIGSTAVVLSIVALVAAYISSVDFVLSIIMRALLGGR